jgi:hypothetical protein
MLEHALQYAERGWPIVPLHTPINGGCSCGNPDCKSIGKHPRTGRGLHDASTDPAVILQWWTRWPDANIGLLTGYQSGVVLDVDKRHEGDKSLAELESEHGPLPPTPKSQTGGGWHLMFKHPGGKIGNRSNLRPGLDLRADLGYIVAAPSLHANGNHYQWIVPPDELAEMPDWLLALITKPKPANKPATPINMPSSVKFAEALRAMRKITMPDGNDGSRRLFSYACRAVEHDLTDAETIAAIRILEQERPFPR